MKLLKTPTLGKRKQSSLILDDGMAADDLGVVNKVASNTRLTLNFTRTWQERGIWYLPQYSVT